jgi:5-methyltetrahydropteroyltriglutamate--homocysteine methyltransferase
MKRSEHRILTTHTGSLPRPANLVDFLNKKEMGEPYDQAAFDARVSRAIVEVVQQQVDTSIDIVGDGEHSKINFVQYAHTRLGGLEEIDEPAGPPALTRDALAFSGAYQDAKTMLAARSEEHRPKRAKRRGVIACTGPVTYEGYQDLEADLRNFKAAVEGREVTEAFITAISPSNIENSHPNRYYATDEEYVGALADALHVEYKAIVDAGFLLQIDDPRMATHYNREPNATIEECRDFIALRVEAVNHALSHIPEDRVRFHTCYSVNIAPRVYDMELKDFVDLMLQIKAAAYSLEASNPRHEHEWEIWKDVKLPDHKLLIPGLVSHCIHLVEHPELVAQRIERFASVVGRERVIASTDCGFGTSAAGDELHPEVAWAKLAALVEGAKIASERLW